MKTFIIIIFLIISIPFLFIFLADVNAKENTKEGINIFPRLYQKNMTCSNTDFVHNDLKERLQTVKVWWGLDNNNNLTELFLNQNTGRWFFMLSFPDKITCGIIGGEMSVPYDKNPYFK